MPSFLLYRNYFHKSFKFNEFDCLYFFKAKIYFRLEKKKYIFIIKQNNKFNIFIKKL